MQGQQAKKSIMDTTDHMQLPTPLLGGNMWTSSSAGARLQQGISYPSSNSYLYQLTICQKFQNCNPSLTNA